MKFFLAVFVLNVVLAVDAKEIDAKIAEKCIKELNIDVDAFKAALEKKTDDVDMSIKCMSKCMLKEKKMITEDGDFDVQQIASSLFMEPENVEVAKPFIESCLKEGKEAEKKASASGEQQEAVTQASASGEEQEAETQASASGEEQKAEKKAASGEQQEAEKKAASGEKQEAEKKAASGEEKEAEKKEVETVVKKEPSCEEAYEMIICVTNKIEKALEDD